MDCTTNSNISYLGGRDSVGYDDCDIAFREGALCLCGSLPLGRSLGRWSGAFLLPLRVPSAPTGMGLLGPRADAVLGGLTQLRCRWML